MDALTFSTARYCLFALLLSAWLPCAANTSPDALSLMPEQPRIDELLAGEKPEGIMFLVMEHVQGIPASPGYAVGPVHPIRRSAIVL